MHSSTNARICKIISIFLLVVNNLPVYTRAESVTLIKMPKQISSRWTWTGKSSGPSGGGVGQWKNSWPGGDRSKPVRYSVCDVSSSTQPNQWVTSTGIFIGPANRVDITIEYAMSNCAVINNQYCRQNFSSYLNRSATQLGSGYLPDPYTNLGLFEKIGTSSPKVLSTGNLDQAENKETFSVKVDAAKTYVYLAFHYQGGCLTLFSVSVQYYRCPSISLSSNLVKLPLTIAPANNSTKVKGFCSSAQHIKPLTNETDLYGYCQDNGEWSTNKYYGECGCDYGYGKVATVSGGSECRACPLGTYKNTVNNSNCTTCPLNSEQDSSRTSCDCKPKFYRTDKETKNDSCSGQPSVPQNLMIAFLNASFVTVTWSPPSDNGGRSDLYYTAECKQCNDQGTECTGECTGSNITVNQNSRLANINSLSAYTYYQLKVYAKNGVSKLAEEKNDMAKYAEYIIRTNETVPGIPVVTVKQLSSTTVFLSWEVEEKNGVITYYQVSYYPVGQSSKVKKFNTTSTNATITGLETEKEYYFQVQASSRLGLGKAAGQTKKVVLEDTNENKPFFSKSIVQGVIAGIVGLLILILIIAIICVCRKRRRHRSNSKEFLQMSPNLILMDGQRMYIDPSNYGSPMEALMCTAEEIDREKIELEKNIGGGEFADVYKGTLKIDPENETVAVKILKPRSTPKNREDFIREASIMGQFKHPNVIALKGVVTRSSDTPMMIVTEYMANGSLDHFLKSHDGQLTVLQLLGMIRGVADGMAYLSGMNFIHRDLAARNILVADNMASKVADFGLSRELDDAEDNPDSVYQTQGGKIPVRWTSPEAIRYRKFSWASDVWSFGILMWEIMSFSERPYWDWDNFQVMDRVDSGYRLPAPMNCPKAIHNLMLDCWEKDKNKRPKFADIVKLTEEMIRSPDKLKDDLCTSRFSTDSAGAQTNFGEVTSVEEWLDNLKMRQYVNLFEQAGLSHLDQVTTLSEEDLSKMGVKLIGHRNKLKKSIKAIRQHFVEQSEADC